MVTIYGYHVIPFLDTVLELNSDPWVITGGTDCLVVGFMGELYGREKEEEVENSTTGPATTEKDLSNVEVNLTLNVVGPEVVEVNNVVRLQLVA